MVRHSTITNLNTARLDDTIELVKRCGAPRSASLDMLQEGWRGEVLLVRADLLVACMAADGRPTRLPSQVRTVLSQIATNGAGPAGTAPGAPPRSRHIPV